MCEGASVDEKAITDVLTRFPNFMRFAVMWHVGGVAGAPRARLSCYFKQKKTSGLACDIDDIRRDLFGRVGRQNPTGGYDFGGADSTPVGGSHRRVYRLACVSAIGVAVGGILGEYLPLAWIMRAAVAFIIIGILILIGKF